MIGKNDSLFLRGRLERDFAGPQQAAEMHLNFIGEKQREP